MGERLCSGWGVGRSSLVISIAKKLNSTTLYLSIHVYKWLPCMACNLTFF